MNDRFSRPGAPGAGPANPAEPKPSAPAKLGGGSVAQPTKTANGLPPVGDIQLKKKNGTYNTYTIQLSYGQIEAIRQALEKDHASPISDELKALFDYYLQTLPGPGEEEEDVKAREEMVSGVAGGEGGEGEEDDGVPIPMPPGEEDDGEVTVAGEGPDDGFGEEDGLPEPPAPEALPDMGGGDDMGGAGDMGIDDRLPAPPRE